MRRRVEVGGGQGKPGGKKVLDGRVGGCLEWRHRRGGEGIAGGVEMEVKNPCAERRPSRRGEENKQQDEL